MKRILVTSSLAVFGLTAPAIAGNLAPAAPDMPVVAPAPMPMAPMGTDWTGFYLGGQAAYGFGDASGTDLDGFMGGLQAGYNYDLGSIVLGAEIDGLFGGLDVDGSSDTIDQIMRLKARAGYDAGRALFYLTGGFARASGDILGASASDNGWAAGAGVDFLVTDNWVGGVEYLHHQFDDFDSTGVDIDVDTVSARVSYRF